MKYKAVILLKYGACSQIFDTLGEAERWLDSVNNNYESTTYIQELDEDYQVKDSFYYTERKK